MKNYVTAAMVTLIATKSFAGGMPEEETQMTVNLLSQTAQQEPETFGEAIGQFLEFAFMALFMILCLLYTSPSPRDLSTSRMPSSA